MLPPERNAAIQGQWASTGGPASQRAEGCKKRVFRGVCGVEACAAAQVAKRPHKRHECFPFNTSSQPTGANGLGATRTAATQAPSWARACAASHALASAPLRRSDACTGRAAQTNAPPHTEVPGQSQSLSINSISWTLPRTPHWRAPQHAWAPTNASTCAHCSPTCGPRALLSARARSARKLRLNLRIQMLFGRPPQPTAARSGAALPPAPTSQAPLTKPRSHLTEPRSHLQCKHTTVIIAHTERKRDTMPALRAACHTTRRPRQC